MQMEALSTSPVLLLGLFGHPPNLATPAEIRAVGANLCAQALRDHDSILGLKPWVLGWD